MSDTQTSEQEKSWPGYTGQCNPEVWNEEAKPAQPTQKKIGQLTQNQVDEYFREVGQCLAVSESKLFKSVNSTML